MSLSILMIGSEALPFSKTGGLADVLGALPLALGALGHRVTLVTPKYRGTQAQGTTRSIHVAGTGGAVAETRVIEQPLDENVKAVLIDRPDSTIATRCTARVAITLITRGALRFYARRRWNMPSRQASRSTSCMRMTGRPLSPRCICARVTPPSPVYAV